MDALKRALRTFAQGFLGVLALLAVPILTDLIEAAAGGGTVTVDVDLWRTVLIAAIAGGLIALISWTQNALEHKTGHNLLPK